MNLFSALPLLLALEFASASQVATLSRDPVHADRHLLQDSSCTLFRQVVNYGPTDDHPDGYDEKSWVCEFPEHGNENLNGLFVEVIESPAIAAHLESATSGSSMMWMSEAILQNNKSQMSIPENAHVEIQNDGFKSRSARVGATGSLKTLVVRITDGDNAVVDATCDQLKNDIFDASTSLKSQMEACSYGKLEIEPFMGKTENKEYISNGVVDVKMDHSIATEANFCKVASAAYNAASEQLGGFDDFDLVMFCLPGVSSLCVGSGSPNSKFSYYKGEYCSSISLQMQFVGNSIGLDSSGTDQTGFMGSKIFWEDNHSSLKMCYNPQKNFQLGWYDNGAETINPLDGAGGREFILNGVSDYNKKNDDALVVLRLEQMDKVKDYYVGFNRAEGINADTLECRNKVTIVRKEEGACDRYGDSKKVASLMPGETHVISGFNGEADVEIKFISLDGGDAKISVMADDSSMDDTMCEDAKKKKEKFKRKENGKKKTCKYYAKKKKCEEKILTGMDEGKSIWEVCKKSCKKCSA